jgi:hypothetical protein
MRIPFYITIPSCFLIILIVWWASTRNIDFLTPPSAAELEKIHRKTIASLPISKVQTEVTDADPVAVTSTEPSGSEPSLIYSGAVDVGELTPPTALDTYSERAPDGAAKLLKLAAELELQKSPQRALLANERVLDLSQANPQQIYLALNNIGRINQTLPAWNQDTKAAHPIVIHIGTGKKFAKILPKIMESVTEELDRSSSGLIQCKVELNIGESIRATDAPTPVAVWMTGKEKKSPSTDVLSFTTNNPDNLHNELLKTLFNLIRGHLSETTSYNPAPEAIDDAKTALSSNITRLLWNEFGKKLNPAPKAR